MNTVFSLITMLKQLRRLNDVTEFNISESAAVTTKTRYYSETFQVSVNDIDDDNNLHIVSIWMDTMSTHKYSIIANE